MIDASSKVKVYFKAIDEVWDNDLSNYNFDIYHLSGWLNASRVIDKGTPKGIVAEYNDKKAFFPIIKRQIDDECWDATSTYGYGGPIIDDALTHEDIDIMLEQIKIFLSEEGCISWFIRLHPIINQGWNTTIGTTITHGPTLMSDLTKSEEEHWTETQNQHRRGIKKALKLNVKTSVEKLSENNIQVFSDIYQETMRKVSADEYYFFDDDYFYNLSKNLQNRLLLITAYQDNIAIASSIYTVCEESGIMQFHLGGTLDAYRNLQASKLIMHVARKWGRENGHEVLNFGGGVGAQLDSLYEFKKGFSSKEVDFKTHRIVINSHKYEQLVAQNPACNEEADTGFFPLYRKTYKLPASDLNNDSDCLAIEL